MAGSGWTPTDEVPTDLILMIQRIRTWWQRQTGEDETPLDGDSPAFFLSLLVHLSLFLVLAFVQNPRPEERTNVVMSALAPDEEEQIRDIDLPTTPVWSELPADKVGSNSANGDDVAQSL